MANKAIKKPVEIKSTTEYTPGSDKELKGVEVKVQSPVGDLSVSTSILTGEDGGGTEYNKVSSSITLEKFKVGASLELSNNDETGASGTSLKATLGPEKYQQGAQFDQKQVNDSTQDTYSAAAYRVLKTAPVDKTESEFRLGGGLEASATYLDNGNTVYSATLTGLVDGKGDVAISNSFLQELVCITRQYKTTMLLNKFSFLVKGFAPLNFVFF